MSKSTYVCQRCGCAVHTWGRQGNWKHAAGRNIRSCGKPPTVVEREAWEKELKKFAEGALAAMRRFLDS